MAVHAHARALERLRYVGYQVKALFKMIDTDGSGDIDIDELITFVWGKEYTSAGAKVCAHICIYRGSSVVVVYDFQSDLHA